MERPASPTKTLQEVYDEKGPLLECFRNWLKRRMCLESLLFFEEVDKYKQLTDEGERLAQAEYIIETFLTSQCEYEINAPREIIDAISEMVAAKQLSNKLFLPIQHGVWMDLKNEAFLKFLESDDFTDFLKNEPESERTQMQRRKLEEFFGEVLIGPLERTELVKVLKVKGVAHTVRAKNLLAQLAPRPQLIKKSPRGWKPGEYPQTTA